MISTVFCDQISKFILRDHPYRGGDMNSNCLPSLKTIEIEKWPHETTRSRRLTMRDGIGISAAILSLYFAIKPASSQAVNQPSCHIEHQNDKITEPLSSVRQCRSCGQRLFLSAFPAKGDGRRESRCNDCHNTHRRERYRSKQHSRKEMSFDLQSYRFDGEHEGFQLLMELICDDVMKGLMN